MNELEDHRDFLAGLPDASSNGGPKPLSPPEISPEIDAGAAHIAASFTELKVSVQRLHTDLAQRMRTMEGKVDAGIPNWRALAGEILTASERGGRTAAERAGAINDALAQKFSHVADVRADDIRLFRKLVYWGALPVFMIAFGALLKLGLDAGRTPAIWFLLAAFGLGVGAVVLALEIKERWAAWRLRKKRGF